MITQNGTVILPTHEIFVYSNGDTKVKEANGKIIKKIWGSGDNYHIKRFKYDDNNNLIEVKSLNRYKIIRWIFNQLIFSLLVLFFGFGNN